MPIKPVFKAEFEGDTFEIIEVSGIYHYRQKSETEVILEGQTPELVGAMQALFVNMSSWAVDIDNGHAKCGGIGNS